MPSFFNRQVVACLIGILVGGVATYTFFSVGYTDHPHFEESEDYHIHADFLIQIEDQLVELGTAELMTTASQTLHKHAHLHDDNGDVLHMHEENISFVEFLSSLDISLDNDCLTLAEGEEFCSTENETINLYVNKEFWTGDFSSYVPQDLDQVLLYYGNVESSSITDYLDHIPDDACIYSGSCPERGIAPPESCGLTCEL